MWRRCGPPESGSGTRSREGGGLVLVLLYLVPSTGTRDPAYSQLWVPRYSDPRSGTCPQVWVPHTLGNAMQKLYVHLRCNAADRPSSVGLRGMPAVQVSNMRNSQQQGAPFGGHYWRCLGCKIFYKCWCAGTEVVSCSFICRNVNINRI